MSKDRSAKSSSDVSEACSVEDKGILVAVRIRPLSNEEIESGAQVCCEVFDNSNIVTISQAGVIGSYLKSQAGTVNEYAFDEVFDSSASQMAVYEKTARPFIPKVLAGLNVTVFAYGATSAGKTHTMFGSSRADSASSRAEAGIIPNAISDLFNSINKMSSTLSVGESWGVNLSYIEVYNEQIYDLLNTVPSGKPLSLREDQEKGLMVIAGVIEQNVESLDDALRFLALGNRNRKTEATMANQVSSRSHAVLQLNIYHTFRLPGGKENTIESKLSLIDLAGSERASATLNRGARLMEGANINKSLLALANCINALAENSGTGKKGNVKYRDSKLTLLLKNSLEGRSNLVIIANINPSHTTLEDSHNTLKYANRAKNIKVNPMLKEVTKDSTWAERYIRVQAENDALKERVVFLEGLVTDLQVALSASTCGTVSTGDENSTVPLWGKKIRLSKLQSRGSRERNGSGEGYRVGEYEGGGERERGRGEEGECKRDRGEEGELPSRLSDSFSSSISSYSDMMEYPFLDEYEAQAHNDNMNSDNLNILMDKIYPDNQNIDITHTHSDILNSNSKQSPSEGMEFEMESDPRSHASSERVLLSDIKVRPSLGPSLGKRQREEQELMIEGGMIEGMVVEGGVIVEGVVEDLAGNMIELNCSVCSFTTASSGLIPLEEGDSSIGVKESAHVGLKKGAKVGGTEGTRDSVREGRRESAREGVSTAVTLTSVDFVSDIPTPIRVSKSTSPPNSEQKQNENVKENDVDVKDFKKRRMSAIPQFARTTSRFKPESAKKVPQSIVVLDNIAENVLENSHENVLENSFENSVGNISKDILGNVLESQENVLESQENVLCTQENQENVLDNTTSSNRMRRESMRIRSCPVGSKRRSMEMAAVTAMLAAMPEHLRATKVGAVGGDSKRGAGGLGGAGSFVGSNSGGLRSVGSVFVDNMGPKGGESAGMSERRSDIGHGNSENSVNNENASAVGSRPPMRRMSMRVQQNTVKALTQRQSDSENIHENNNNDNNNSNNNNSNYNSNNNTPMDKRLSAIDNRKSITRRKSYLKLSAMKSKVLTPLSRLSEEGNENNENDENENGLQSDAWMAI